MRARTGWGVAASLSSLAILSAAMLPWRPQLSVATDALLLIVPVVVGVAVGGFLAGVAAAAVGFLIYDWFFIPPYGTLTVGRPQNWVALFVYLSVVLIVARVVAVQQESRSRALQREDAVRELFVVTEQLIGARPIDDVLALVAETVRATFHTRFAAVLLPHEDSLVVAAVAGDEMTRDEHDLALGLAGSPQPMALVARTPGISRVALATGQGPVGQLVIAGGLLSAFERELLGNFANQAALAIERSQLREMATRTRELEEADKWRSSLMGAVSHDLRTPLASVKLAVSMLRNPDAELSDHDRSDLLEMIEDQSDHLARLVANLLDTARLDAGALVLHRSAHSIDEIIDTALRSLGTTLLHHRLVTRVAQDLPLVDVDLVLISQVLANLLANAAQHSPSETTVTVRATLCQGGVEISVSDRGKGVAPEERERIFHMLDRRAGSGRAGLGLSIATSFVVAHGGIITVDDAPAGGARFSFVVPLASLEDELS